jgi:endonuclease/exonuclease/phosphatase family metal-dependent hydrolase
VRLALWNIRHAELRGLAALAEAIAPLQPDLVALVEVDRGCARSGAVDQAAWLGGALGLVPSFAAAIPFDGGEYGVALLCRPGLAPAQLQVVRLPSAAGAAGPILEPSASSARSGSDGWALRGLGADRSGEEPRAVLLATLPDLRVGVVHLDLPPATRAAQARAIRPIALSPGPPILLAGDFNEPPGGPALAPLLQSGLRDAWREAGAAERSTSPVDRPAGRIDLLLLGPGAPRATDAGALDSAASDHPLLWFELAP